MRRTTCKGGPLNGKTYDIPNTQDTIPAEDGVYVVDDTVATWRKTKVTTTTTPYTKTNRR